MKTRLKFTGTGTLIIFVCTILVLSVFYIFM